AGQDAAGDRGDAAEIGRCEETDAGQGCVCRGRGHILLVAEQAAADGCDEGGDGERSELDATYVDACGSGGALVGANRQHGSAEPAAAQPGDTDGDDHEDEQAGEAESQAWVTLTGADAQ